MNNNLLYSIIVPVYGVEKLLKKCVDSLVNQTYSNIEIILVDDGSKDGSPKICDQYANSDNRVKVIHKINGGSGSARKAGALAASGEYIICVDADDWIDEKYVETFNNVTSKYAPDIVCCGYIQTDEHTEEYHHIPTPAGNYDYKKIQSDIYPFAIESEYGDVFPPQLWAKAFKRELFLQEQLPVNNLIKIGEDGAVVKPILTKIKSLYMLDECLYYYRVNNQSITRNRSAYDWNGPRYIYEHLMDRINVDKFDFEEQIIRRTTRDIYMITFSQFNRKENYMQIRKNIKEQLSAEDYKEIVLRCKYKGIKHKLETFLLKHQLILPIYLLHTIRK